MKCQKNKFNLDNNFTFLNGAYMSPLLLSSVEAGINGLKRKFSPANFTKDDFFDGVDRVRALFSELIHAEHSERVAVCPSASYALSNIAGNIPKNGRKEIILLEDQFPSNYYIWARLAEERGLKILTVSRPKSGENSWTAGVLNAIGKNTLVVSLPVVHWGDGTVFNLGEISTKARAYGAPLIIDGTQSIGALPFDQSEIQADAVVVSAYKWLLGPYGIGLAYYNSVFDGGKPIEESWLNRLDSDDFQYLTNYRKEYRPGARRYEMGEAPDFIKMPMLEDSLRQLTLWRPENIQKYCRAIVQPIMEPLMEAGYTFCDEKMAYHLFGIRPPEGMKIDVVKKAMDAAKISVSFRKEVLRVAPNVYNNLNDTVKLKDALLQIVQN